MPDAESISLCPICGKKVSQDNPGRQRKFCSRKCCLLSSSRAQAERKRLSEDAVRPMVSCPICGTEFKKIYNKKYCSDLCKKKSATAEDRIKQRAAYREKNKERIKEYREKNIERIRAQKREYMREKLKNDYDLKEKQRLYNITYKKNNPIKVMEWNAKLKAKRRRHNAHVQAWKAYNLRLTEKHDQHVKCFIKFKKTASTGWLARYYKSIGKPWNNPQFTDAIKYKIRYRLDHAFRLSEINRTGWRKNTLASRDDGTANFWTLLRERKSCPYCGTSITMENAVADHMDPIKLGGSNGQHNLTICCRNCNQKKSAKSFAEWLETLPQSRHRAARLWYIRKHGHPPDHPNLGFNFVFA